MPVYSFICPRDEQHPRFIKLEEIVIPKHQEEPNQENHKINQAHLLK